MSIVSVTTSFDIIFCGSIAVVVLQADQYLFSTIMTDSRLEEMSKEFSLVLTRRQCERLEVELSVVFWSAFAWMLFGYVATANMTALAISRPEEPYLGFFFMIAILGFALTTGLVVELRYTCREISEGIKSTKRELAVRFGIAAIRKLVSVIFYFIGLFLMDFIYNSKRHNLQAAAGDILYKVPYSLIGNYLYEGNVDSEV